MDRLQLFLGLGVTRLELELLGDDRQVGYSPLLQLLVVDLGVDELDEVPDGEGDDVLVALVVSLFVLDGARQRVREIAGDRGLLCDDQCLHAGHSSEGLAQRRCAETSRKWDDCFAS